MIQQSATSMHRPVNCGWRCTAWRAGVQAAVQGAALLLASAALTPALAQQREPFPGLDAYITAAIKQWKVPGLGMAIVRNDSVIYARGYGVREVGRPEAVDDKTVFAIGSSSKAFTSAAVAMLVDEKKVVLDASPGTYFPGFQLYDPYASRELTVRDLLSHRSGLARGELAWYGSGFDRDEIVRRVRYLKPSWSFRAQFGYQNIMYITAGQVVAKVSGRSWDDFIRERIFTPLHMTASSSSIKGLESVTDLAQPHAELNDTVRKVPWRNIDNAGPAGSINSNAADMAQWLRLQLGRGKYEGKQLISSRMTDEMHQAQMVIRVDSAARANNPDTHLQAYGMGWFLEDYRGRFVVHHGGNVDGFTALVAMMPEEKFGVVFLTNMNGTGLPNALMHKVFDLQLKAPAKDWSGEALKRLEAQRARARQMQARQESQRVANTRPTLPLSAYAGTYVDSLYGDVVVKEENGKLQLTFGPNWRGEMEHYQYDAFRVKFDTPVLPVVPAVFQINGAGKVESVQLDMAGVAEFRKKPDGAPMNR
ncbi:MAG: serine hydrolase [Gemmatimonadaceae bacterium]|nr:serine hydrolase [Gemmatimonadaceae bacterium]